MWEKVICYNRFKGQSREQKHIQAIQAIRSMKTNFLQKCKTGLFHIGGGKSIEASSGKNAFVHLWTKLICTALSCLQITEL